MGGWNIGWGGFGPKSWNKQVKKTLFGDEAKMGKVSNLDPEQEPIKQQLYGAAQQSGAGGAFGTAADYYRDLMSNDSQTFNQMAAPEQRRFNEQIVPDLAEQFAGMGAGGSSLGGSGFQNAAVGAGTDLSERLGAIRANLRAQGAQGLQNIGNSALQSYGQNTQTPASGGLMDYAAPALGAAATAFGGPALGAVANTATNWLKNSTKGKSSPYGGPAPTAQGYDQEFRQRGFS